MLVHRMCNGVGKEEMLNLWRRPSSSPQQGAATTIRRGLGRDAIVTIHGGLYAAAPATITRIDALFEDLKNV
jgi:hypothetical protein